MSEDDSQPDVSRHADSTIKSFRAPGDVLRQVQEPFRESLLTQLIQLEMEKVYDQSDDLSSKLVQLKQLKLFYLEQCPGYEDQIVREFSRAEQSLRGYEPSQHLRRDAQPAGTSPDETYFEIPSQSPSESHTEQFKILRSHATGGLGEVFVALDQGLNREVALKEIKARFSDDKESRERFVREAEITGGLEHPGIVPVYASGQFADGRPFYVMRFIRGESLQEAIGSLHEESTKSKRKALFRILRRLIDACNAIAYAHSRGVIHRDIKPSNIMLGKHGETLVVDWGVARAVGRQEDSSENLDEGTIRPGSGSTSSTLVGSAIGTPAYMSPEQAQGDLEAVGPASDVYSLGATLYCILCKTPPFTQGNVDNVIRQVTLGNFRPPSDIHPDVPPALEAICLRAMAKAPQDRYPSALALAEDLECFLTDTPVSCFQDPWLTKLTRRIRQYQATSAFVLASIVVGLLSLGIFWNQEHQQNLALADLNADLDESNQALILKGEMERKQREASLANEAEAQRQSELALDLVNFIVTEVQQQLSSRPGVGDVRRDILQKAMNQLDAISSHVADSEAVDRNMLTILDSMGQLSIRFDLGGLEEEDIPSIDSGFEQGLKLLLKAQKIAERLHQKLPEDVELEAKLLGISLGIAKAHRFAGALDSTGEFLQTTQRCRDLVTQHRGRLDLKLFLAESLAYTAHSLAFVERLDEAESFSAEGLQLAGELLELALNDEQRAYCVQSKALLHRVQGNLAVQLRQDQALAERQFQASLELIDELAAARPNDWTIRRELQIALSRLGKTLVKQNKHEQAWVHFERLLDLVRNSLEIDPQNVSLQNNLASTEFSLGELRLQLGDLPESEQHLKRSREIFSELVREGFLFERSYANAHLVSARLAARTDRLSEAENFFNIAAEIRRKHSQEGSTRAYRELSSLLDSMATLYLRLEKGEQAVTLMQESIAACESALKKDPANIAVRQQLANSLSILASIHIDRKESQAAITVLERELDYRRNLSLDRKPSRSESDRRLLAQKKLAQLLVAAGHLDRARTLLENSVRLFDDREQTDQEDLERQLSVYEDLASIAEQLQDDVCQLQYLRDALDTTESINSNSTSQQRSTVPLRLQIHTLLRQLSAKKEAAEMAGLAWQESAARLAATQLDLGTLEDSEELPAPALELRKQALIQASKVKRIIIALARESDRVKELLMALRERLQLESELSQVLKLMNQSSPDASKEPNAIVPMRLAEFEARYQVAEHLWEHGKREEAIQLMLVNGVAAAELEDKPLHLSKMAPRIIQFAELLAADDHETEPLRLPRSRILALATITIRRNNSYRRLQSSDVVPSERLADWQAIAMGLIEEMVTEEGRSSEELNQTFPELRALKR